MDPPHPEARPLAVAAGGLEISRQSPGLAHGGQPNEKDCITSDNKGLYPQ